MPFSSPKSCVFLHMQPAPPWPVILQIARAALPLCALGVCLMEGMPLAVLVWIGTFSIAGLVSGGGLAAAMTRRDTRMSVRSIIRD